MSREHGHRIGGPQPEPWPGGVRPENKLVPYDEPNPVLVFVCVLFAPITDMVWLVILLYRYLDRDTLRP